MQHGALASSSPLYQANPDVSRALGYPGLRVKELLDAKAAGKVVVGAFCVFVPEELVLAANGVCVGLCAAADFGTDQAERYLPRNTCALIKSFFGFSLEKVGLLTRTF